MEEIDIPPMRIPDKKAPPRPPKPIGQPSKATAQIPEGEWLAVHSADPSSVYAIRTRAWRPRPPAEGATLDTKNGPFGSFVKGAPECPACLATVREVYDIHGNMRCLGCGGRSSD